MDTAVVKVASKLARTYIEEVLGFGRPVNDNTYSALFKNNSAAVRYAANGSNFQANINGTPKESWHASHFSEKGTVLHDVYSAPVERIHDFISKEIGKRGLQLVDGVSDAEANTFRRISASLQKFLIDYKDNVAHNAACYSTMTLRPVEDNNNWDLMLRIGVFSDVETIYLQFYFPRLVRGLALWVENHQVAEAIESISLFLENFEGHTLPFEPLLLGEIDLCKIMAHLVIHNPEVTPQVIWQKYHDMVYANEVRVCATVKRTPGINNRTIFNDIVEWNMLTEIQRHIVSSSLDLMKTYIRTFLNYNMLVAGVTA